MSSEAPRIIFFGTEDWFFLSHRLNLGRRCLAEGWRVTVAARVQNHGDALVREGFRVSPIPFRRGSMNPIMELRTLCRIIAIIAQEKPDIIHLVGLKLILYGSVAAVFSPRLVVINAVAGLGTLFTSQADKPSFIRSSILLVLPWLLNRKRSWTIVQNRDDKTFFEGMVTPARVILIPGSGVNLEEYRLLPEPDGVVTAAVVSRMLREKGIIEVIQAARVLNKRNVDVRIKLIGAPDPENPSSIPTETLQEWHDEGLVEWLGYCEDIRQVWANAHIAVLPSHREGFPKSLIEATASGRPAITTDTIGCREVIEDGVSGFVVPLCDAEAIADALEKLVSDPALRRRMGSAARERTERMFADTIIADKTMEFYHQALAS